MTSVSNKIPYESKTFFWIYLINSLISDDDALFALIIKFEWIWEISAPPQRNPFKPSSSINFAAFKGSGLRKTLPQVWAL